VVQFQTGEGKGGFTLEAQSREESTQGEEAFNLFAVSFASLRLCVRLLPDKDGPQLQPEPPPEKQCGMWNDECGIKGSRFLIPHSSFCRAEERAGGRKPARRSAPRRPSAATFFASKLVQA
jgi:hypothetical protein